MRMERVNLLPEEARMGPLEFLLQLVDKEFPRVLGTVLGVLVILGILLAVGQGMTLQKKKQKLAELKRQSQLLKVESQNLESFSKQLDQVEQELQRQKKILEWKIEYLNVAKERPRIWASVLRDLRQSIPRGVWLTELETGTGRSLRIAGGSTDENLVTQFMSNLKESPHFTNVGFTYTEKDTIGNVPVVKFEVVCRSG